MHTDSSSDTAAPAAATVLSNLASGAILPGAWLGMLGGGQLGRMFCFAAQSMGYRVAVLDPDETSPAGAVADRHIRAAYTDEAALTELAQQCAAVSTEFENVPAHSLDFLARTVTVSPASRCVAIAQDRLLEKSFIRDCGVPVAPHLALESREALAALSDAQIAAVLPGILKTARLGYDGKGQVSVATPTEVREAHAALGHVACVLEKRLALAFEVSALVARGADGRAVVYPLAQNVHRDGVLAQTVAPAPDASSALAAQAQNAALAIAEALGYVGVLCIEFFVLADGTLVANEMAPRPHNSAHYTVDACATSQFEQQVRAMARLPLGDPRQHSPAVMLNLLGDVWFESATPKQRQAPSTGHAAGAPLVPAWDQVAALAPARLHLYGKEEARPGRKMGHITCAAATLALAQQAAAECVRILHLPH
jgi:5-(carboxyamino)imidazole ribonucleotide synthase